MKIEYFPEASSELAELAEWFETNRRSGRRNFLQAVDATLDLLVRYPRAGRQWPRRPRLRRLVLPTFQTKIIYLVGDESIRIVAFARDQRRPNYWMTRLKH